MSDQNQKLSVFEKAGYSAGDAAANFVFMIDDSLPDELLHGQLWPHRQRRGRHFAVAAIVGRLLRSDHGRPRRPHQHALGQIPAVGSLDRGSLGGRDDSGLYHAEGLEHGRDGGLRRHHQHDAHDALFDEQHALLGTRRRHDRRSQRAHQAQFLPVHLGQYRPVHRRQSLRCRWSPNSPSATTGNTAGK